MKTKLILTLCFAVSAFALCAQPLVVHEWGTFTSLQDEAGRTLGGINTDDEAVPPFCHDLDKFLVVRTEELPPILFKGAPRCMPEITMRLETPVIYFHRPAGATKPLTASIRVAFRGGWLTQYYPGAETGGFARADKLNEGTKGTLAWNDLQIGGEAKGPETTERVWTAPRAVEAASVTARNGESEKFLFYRGIGHLQCPLQMSRTRSDALECRAQAGEARLNCPPLSIQRLWLASFHPDGGCAFRSLPAINLAATAGESSRKALFSTPAGFGGNDFSAGNQTKLRHEMWLALQEEGLFADEADALLNTWELSYFKSPGLRLFFMVPRAWTDAYLPLEISVPCELKRVMIGRLELVTPEQRSLLKELAQAPKPAKPWAFYAARDNKTVLEGVMPPAYRALGRFRNALLLEEYKVRPAASLEAFIRLNGLQGSGG
jgi:hypothetical protein